METSYDKLLRFYRAHLSRAKRNLVAAEDRKDHKAVKNLKTKIKIYQDTINLVVDAQLN